MQENDTKEIVYEEEEVRGSEIYGFTYCFSSDPEISRRSPTTRNRFAIEESTIGESRGGNKKPEERKNKVRRLIYGNTPVRLKARISRYKGL